MLPSRRRHSAGIRSSVIRARLVLLLSLAALLAGSGQGAHAAVQAQPTTDYDTDGNDCAGAGAVLTQPNHPRRRAL